MIIAIDGPTASGKGTVAKRLAAHYSLAFLDTGLLYRGVAAALIRAGCEGDEDAAERLARGLDLDVFGEAELRSARTGAEASRVASMPRVRAALKQLQRDFAAQDGGAVLDGRDIGTVICPDADVKIWVDAKPKIRAARRHAELERRGETISFEDVLAQLQERDGRDASRPDAPMKRASDAHLLDTSDMSIDRAFEAARRIVDQTIAEKRF